MFYKLSILSLMIERKPPKTFSTVHGELVLWYDGLPLPTDPKLTDSQLSCLSEVIGNRVNKRAPPAQPIPVLDSQGRPRLNNDGKPILIVRRRNITAGGSGVDMHIIFKNDGSVLKLISI